MVAGERKGRAARVGAGRSWALVGWIVACFSAAASTPVARQDGWYAALAKPSWNPPGWLFGPVWTTLYLLMAIAAWLIWCRGGFRGQARALSLFVAQLVVNAAWSPLFFGLHSIGWALVDLVAMWVLLALTLRAFSGVSRVAAGLLMPYLAWVTFAGYLNYTIWQLNR